MSPLKRAKFLNEQFICQFTRLFYYLFVLLVSLSFKPFYSIKMDVADNTVGQRQHRDEIGIRCQKLFQDFLEEYELKRHNHLLHFLTNGPLITDTKKMVS